jgi:beta-phosphoglucomutase
LKEIGRLRIIPRRRGLESGKIGRNSNLVKDLTVPTTVAIMKVGFEDSSPADPRYPMAVRAVLFDFDGVIADTENHHIAAWQRTLTALGWQVPDDVAARSAELDDRQFLRELFATQGIVGGEIDAWVRKKQVLTIQMLRDAPRLYPGVVELVGQLRGRVRMAVVSGTWRENVEAVLTSSGLDQAFEFIVGKEDVSAVKPDPEAYQLALSRLEVGPGDVVAIEDSPTGLAAASAAGRVCIAVGHRREFGDWVGNATYVSGLEPAAGLLQRMGL